MSAKRSSNTADKILDIAEKLVQVRGFNAFSYADISQVLKIQKASLHHHFVTKSALGQALITRYRKNFQAELKLIETSSDSAVVRLERYIELYSQVLSQNRMCLCGMLATDIATLPKPMRDGVAKFFAENEVWLSRVLEAGREEGALEFEGSPESVASLFVSSLEGAMLVARGNGQPKLFQDVARRLLDHARGGRPKRARRAG